MDDLAHGVSRSEVKRLIYSFIAMLVISLVGNTFVICHIARSPQLRKKHLLFLNLSIADVLATLTIYPHMASHLTIETYWTTGTAFCKVFVFVIVLMEGGSMYAVLIVTIRRIQVLVKPPCPSLSNKAAVLGSWLLALFPALPQLYTATELHVWKEHYLCHFFANLDFKTSTFAIYFPILFTFLYYLPLLSGAIMYAVIFLKAKPWTWFRDHSKTFKVFLLSLTLYGTALFTSIPYLIVQNLLVFSNNPHKMSQIDDWLYFLALSRCAINPYIYIVFHFNEVFRRRALDSANSELLDTTYTENVTSSATPVTQETTA